jgi:uncharacterized coiled-coil DUF342 family protein
LKPTRDDLEKKLDAVEDEIDKIYKHLHHYIEEVRRTMAGIKDKKDAYPVHEMLQAKTAERKTIRDQLKKLKEEYDEKNDEMDDLYDQAKALRQKMKILSKPEEIVNELKELRDRQANEHLTAA